MGCTRDENQPGEKFYLNKPITDIGKTYLSKQALVTARIGEGDHIVVEADPEKGEIRIYKDTGVRA